MKRLLPEKRYKKYYGQIMLYIYVTFSWLYKAEAYYKKSMIMVSGALISKA